MTATSAWDRVRAVLHAEIDDLIAYHGPWGETSQEQWTWDAEKELVRQIKADDDLIDKLVAAATENGSEAT